MHCCMAAGRSGFVTGHQPLPRIRHQPLPGTHTMPPKLLVITSLTPVLVLQAWQAGRRAANLRSCASLLSFASNRCQRWVGCLTVLSWVSCLSSCGTCLWQLWNKCSFPARLWTCCRLVTRNRRLILSVTASAAAHLARLAGGVSSCWSLSLATKSPFQEALPRADSAFLAAVRRPTSG